MKASQLDSGLLGGAKDSAAGGGDRAPIIAAGGRSLKRQVVLLLRKQLALKKRAWRWTLLEAVFPLQPILFLYLIFNLGDGLLPYEKKVTDAASSSPMSLWNATLPSMAGMMQIGGSVGFSPPGGASPTAAADAAAARAIHATFCGVHDAVLTAPAYQEASQQAMQMAASGDLDAAQLQHMAAGMGQTLTDAQAEQAAQQIQACRAAEGGKPSLTCQMFDSIGKVTPGSCLWFSRADGIDSAGGWLPFADQMAKMQGGGAAAPANPGLYLGVEVGQHSMRVRYEELLLAENANAEPMEQNTARSGILAMQAVVSSLASTHAPPTTT